MICALLSQSKTFSMNNLDSPYGLTGFLFSLSSIGFFFGTPYTEQLEEKMDSYWTNLKDSWRDERENWMTKNKPGGI